MVFSDYLFVAAILERHRHYGRKSTRSKKLIKDNDNHHDKQDHEIPTRTDKRHITELRPFPLSCLLRDKFKIFLLIINFLNLTV